MKCDLRERPLPWQLREVESKKFLLQVVVEIDKLAVAPRGEVTAGHINIKHYVLVPLFVSCPVIWNRYGQGPLLGIVDVRITRSFFLRFQTLSLLKGKRTKRVRNTLRSAERTHTFTDTHFCGDGYDSQQENVPPGLDEVHNLFVRRAFNVHAVPAGGEDAGVTENKQENRSKTYTSRIRSPLTMPALSAAPALRTALTC